MDKIDTLVISGGGPSGIAYLGVFKGLYEKKIIRKNLEGIKEIISCSIGFLPAFLFSISDNYTMWTEIVESANLSAIVNTDDISLDKLLNGKGLFSNQLLYDICESILNNIYQKKTITLKELYDLTNIKLTTKVYNITKRIVEYISHENYPELDVKLVAKMTTSIPLFFEPVEYNGCIYVDGGIRGSYPIEKCNSKNYLGLFIIGGMSLNESTNIPLINQMISIACDQDLSYYKKDDRELRFEINNGWDFDMTKEKRKEIIDKGYKLTLEQAGKFIQSIED